MGSIAAGCRCSKPRSSTALGRRVSPRSAGSFVGESPRQSIAKLDARLCDIKDLSVRDGLHVFGRTPEPHAQSALRSSHRDREWSVFRGGSASHDRKRRRGVCNERARGFAGRARRPSRSGGAIRRSQPWPRRCPPYWTQPDIARSARRADPDGCCHRRSRGKRSRSTLSAGSRRLSARAGNRPVGHAASLRTGGDDLAQAFAYLGVRPVWDFGSHASPASKCFRSRCSTGPASTYVARLRLFRDLFETQIALFDMAARKVAALDEDDADNPLAAVRRRGKTSRAYSAVRPAAMARAPRLPRWTQRGRIAASWAKPIWQVRPMPSMAKARR